MTVLLEYLDTIIVFQFKEKVHNIERIINYSNKVVIGFTR